MKLPIPSSRRRPWLDPRFVIGLVLVAASVGGMIAVVSAFDRGRPVYVARGTLLSGQQVAADDLAVASVSIGAAADSYLNPASMPTAGVVVTRTIAGGELIPLSAVGSTADDGFSTVVVELSARVGADVGPGTVVDLWAAAPATGGGGFESPRILVGSVSVVRLVEEDGLMVSNRGLGVELRLPRASIAAVLEAVSGEFSLAVVAVSAPWGG